MATVSPVEVGFHLVDGLDANLEPSAAVAQHVGLVPFQAIVGPRLDGDADALGPAPLRIPNRLVKKKPKANDNNIKSRKKTVQLIATPGKQRQEPIK